MSSFRKQFLIAVILFAIIAFVVTGSFVTALVSTLFVAVGVAVFLFSQQYGVRLATLIATGEARWPAWILTLYERLRKERTHVK